MKRALIWKTDLSKDNDHICTMKNHNLEFDKSLTDFEVTKVLCTIKLNLESHHLGYWSIQSQLDTNQQSEALLRAPVKNGSRIFSL